LFVTGLLVFAPLLLREWNRFLPESMEPWGDPLFWIVAGIVVTGPLLGAWRRLTEFVTALLELGLTSDTSALQPVLQIALELMTAFLMFIWVWLLTPVSGASGWFFGAIIVTTVLSLLVFGTKIRFAHHHIDRELAEAILSADEKRQRAREDWLKDHQEWDLSLSELRVPDAAEWFGRSLGDLGLRRRFGCSIVGMERQGYSVASPGPDTEIFPNDVLLVLGTETQIESVRKFFETPPSKVSKLDLLEEVRLESVEVPEKSRVNGCALAELDIPRQTGIQIAGVYRGEFRILSPGPFQVLEPGDWLLIVGTRPNILRFREWLSEA
jgi:CPA2 family monovalent cation:H+ antiporter-2